MIQKQTMLEVADNSGAKKLMVIQIKGGTGSRFARIGDIVKVTVKKAGFFVHFSFFGKL